MSKIMLKWSIRLPNCPTLPGPRSGCWAVLILMACTPILCVNVNAGSPRTGDFGNRQHPEVGEDRVLQLLSDHCFDCHGHGQAEGGMALDDLWQRHADDALEMAGPEMSEEDKRQWWRVLQNVRAGTMPPPEVDSPLPPDSQASLLQWIKYRAFGIDPQRPDPGRVTFGRLNRVEYRNTIRDLLNYDYDTDLNFPADDSGFGFDNVGDALTLSPLLLEKYFNAASEIISATVPTQRRVMPVQRIAGRGMRQLSNWNMKEAKQGRRNIEIQRPGDYRLIVNLHTHGSFEFSPQRCRFTVRMGDEILHEDEYGWNESKIHALEYEFSWEPGTQILEFHAQPLPLPSPPTGDPNAWATIGVHSIVLEGPLDPSAWETPENYTAFFPLPQPPADPAARRDYARRLLGEFATRAFRRPVDDASLDRLMELFQQIEDAQQHTFEAAIARVMIPVLASPRFLFRQEGLEPGQPAEEPFPLIDQHALAARLSYFLWSSMPDQRLMDLAQSGQLRQELLAEVRRMLADPKATALTENFVGQWLRTRDIHETSIDVLDALDARQEFEELRREFGRRRRPPSERQGQENSQVQAQRERFAQIQRTLDLLNHETKTAMRRETELLFEHILRENRSLKELIDPGYTFLNDRLAELYDLPPVQGSEMRKVDLPPDSWRGGLLTQGTLLWVTSNPTRTSPVKRGLYVLENLLGTPPPPAPPDVPELEESASQLEGQQPSLRQLLAVHRESSLCASCHQRMDPLGLALEHFNAVGIWRDSDQGQPIDAAGQLITGESFRDVRDLRQIIAHQRSDDLYRSVTSKMLIYALRRGLDYYDEHTIDQIVQELHRQDGAAGTLIEAIVQSAPFQRSRRPPTAEPGMGVGERSEVKDGNRFDDDGE